MPWAALPRRVLGRYRALAAIDSEAPGAFRYAEPWRIDRDFAAAAFSIEHVEEIDVPVIEAETGAGIAAWVLDLGLARGANELSPAEAAAWQADLAREAEQFRVGDMIRVGGVTRIVVGRART